jgi:hypothetical protein
MRRVEKLALYLEQDGLEYSERKTVFSMASEWVFEDCQSIKTLDRLIVGRRINSRQPGFREPWPHKALSLTTTSPHVHDVRAVVDFLQSCYRFIQSYSIVNIRKGDMFVSRLRFRTTL